MILIIGKISFFMGLEFYTNLNMRIKIIVILFLVSTLHSLAHDVRGVVTTNVNVRWKPTTKSDIGVNHLSIAASIPSLAYENFENKNTILKYKIFLKIFIKILPYNIYI